MSRDDVREAEADVAACRRAHATAEVLAVEIAAEQKVCQVLRGRLQDEQADVDALEDTSIRSVVARLRGHRDELLDRERAEVAAVELELATHRSAMRRLTPDFETARERAQGLAVAQERLTAALQRRAEALAAHPEHAARLADVDARLGAERAAFDQIRDARVAALGAAGAIDRALESMSSAHKLSSFDTFLNGGTIISSLKQGRLDSSVETLAEVHVALLQLRPLLAGIADDVHHPTLQLPSTGVAMDVWFDNIFTDLRSHGKITGSLRELQRSRSSVGTLLEELAAYEALSRPRVDGVEAERAGLLRGPEPGS